MNFHSHTAKLTQFALWLRIFNARKDKKKVQKVIDPIVYQLDMHDKRARNAYEQTAQYWFENFVGWNSLTTAERDYWRTHVL